MRSSFKLSLLLVPSQRLVSCGIWRLADLEVTGLLPSATALRPKRLWAPWTASGSAREPFDVTGQTKRANLQWPSSKLCRRWAWRLPPLTGTTNSQHMASLVTRLFWLKLPAGRQLSMSVTLLLTQLPTMWSLCSRTSGSLLSLDSRLIEGLLSLRWIPTRTRPWRSVRWTGITLTDGPSSAVYVLPVLQLWDGSWQLTTVGQGQDAQCSRILWPCSALQPAECSSSCLPRHAYVLSSVRW